MIIVKKIYVSIFALFLLLIISCSASKISVKNDKIKKISTIAVLPFDKGSDMPELLALECEESFRNGFIDAGFIVVERKKIAQIMKENEISMALSSYSDQMVSILGADTILSGQITQYNESVRNIEYMGYDRDDYGFEITHKTDATTHKEIQLEKKKIKDTSHTLNFKIYIRLISVNTGEVILVMENMVSSKTYNERQSRLLNYSLSGFKNEILQEMNKELKEAIIKARQK